MTRISYILGAAAALFVMAGTSALAAPDCGLDNGKKAEGEPILIGAVVGRTGPDDFSSSARAAAAYFNCVNANGGINGRPIKYLVEDDQWNPEVAGQVATKLVKDEKVLALVASGSFVEMGVNAKLVEKAGAWYGYDGERIGQGKENARQYLKENPAAAAKLEAALREIHVPDEAARGEDDEGDDE